jgi:hypothetical protein
MLRQMARKTDKLVGECNGLPDCRICRIEAGLADMVVGIAVAVTPYGLGKRSGP